MRQRRNWKKSIIRAHGKKYLKKVDRNSYNRKNKSVVSKQEEEETGLQSQVRQKGTAR